MDEETINEDEKYEKVLNDITIGSKNPDSIAELKRIIKKHIRCFALDDEQLGTTSQVEYDIDTGDSSPVAQQRYRCPYYQREAMKTIIQNNVEKGLMKPCSSPYAAPCLLVKKPNGSWRLVCDYRKLNNVTTSDHYPLPLIPDLVDCLSKSKVFSAADLFTGFHQIKCSERAQEKLAITTEWGQFTWLHMPMGGKNAPAVFQRLMDNVFRSIPQDQLIVYLDDLLVHSQNEHDNLSQLDNVLGILGRSNLKIRAKKTEFLTPCVKFCGFIIEDGSRYPNPEKVAAIKELCSPRSKQEAQRLFGLLNYHRNFIPNFAKKAAAITESYRKSFHWTKSAEQSLTLLKNEICNAALQLTIPNIQNACYVLETDASKTGYGCCLYICTQESPDHQHSRNCLRPVEYESKMFNQAQMNYGTMEKELLAGRQALRKWSHYLLGRRFTWITDNSCLTWAYKIRSRKL